jgi:hypothetical protein
MEKRMTRRTILLLMAVFVISAVPITPSESSDLRRQSIRPADSVVRYGAVDAGYYGGFAPNGYDYNPYGHGNTVLYGFALPAYGYGCFQRTVVLTIFGPRLRRVWVCD